MTDEAAYAGIPPQLRPFFDMAALSDIVINDSGSVWVDCGNGMEKTDIELDGSIRHIAMRMAGICGKRLDDASPVVDGVLPGGVRLHAVLAPICSSPAVISLRIGRQETFNLDRLRHAGMMDGHLQQLLGAIIAARLSVFISGATGSGKTTLLSAMLGEVPGHERIVCIEEVSELKPDHCHVVHLQERKPNIQNRGTVTMSELVRAAMRMRPDRIVLGECRGEEVKDVLAAMNTGHEGSCATVHANAAEDVPARLIALGALAAMPASAVAAQAKAAIDVVIHITRRMGADGRMRRWISQIGLPDMEASTLSIMPAITVGIDGRATESSAMKRIERMMEARGIVLAGGAR